MELFLTPAAMQPVSVVRCLFPSSIFSFQNLNLSWLHDLDQLFLAPSMAMAFLTCPTLDNMSSY